MEQARAARALCEQREAFELRAKDTPFDVPGHDPFDITPELDPDEAAWLLVCGDATPEECAGIDLGDDAPPVRW